MEILLRFNSFIPKYPVVLILEKLTLFFHLIFLVVALQNGFFFNTGVDHFLFFVFFLLLPLVLTNS